MLLGYGNVQVGTTLDYEPGSVIAVEACRRRRGWCTMGAVTIGGRLEVSDSPWPGAMTTGSWWRAASRGAARGVDHTVHAEVSAESGWIQTRPGGASLAPCGRYPCWGRPRHDLGCRVSRMECCAAMSLFAAEAHATECLMPLTIQRTWGVLFNQWSEEEQRDPAAQLFVGDARGSGRRGGGGSLWRCGSSRRSGPSRSGTARRSWARRARRHAGGSSSRRLENLDNATLCSICERGKVLEELLRFRERSSCGEDAHPQYRLLHHEASKVEGFSGTNLGLREVILIRR